MSGYLDKVVYLSETQKDTLFAKGAITVNGVTTEYSDSALYLTPTDNIEEVDNGINVTGASVGDIVRVAAVDDNGVPTAWEATGDPRGVLIFTKKHTGNIESEIISIDYENSTLTFANPDVASTSYYAYPIILSPKPGVFAKSTNLWPSTEFYQYTFRTYETSDPNMFQTGTNSAVWTFTEHDGTDITQLIAQKLAGDITYQGDLSGHKFRCEAYWSAARDNAQIYFLGAQNVEYSAAGSDSIYRGTYTRTNSRSSSVVSNYEMMGWRDLGVTGFGPAYSRVTVEPIGDYITFDISQWRVSPKEATSSDLIVLTHSFTAVCQNRGISQISLQSGNYFPAANGSWLKIYDLGAVSR